MDKVSNYLTLIIIIIIIIIIGLFNIISSSNTNTENQLTKGFELKIANGRFAVITHVLQSKKCTQSSGARAAHCFTQGHSINRIHLLHSSFEHPVLNLHRNVLEVKFFVKHSLKPKSNMSLDRKIGFADFVASALLDKKGLNEKKMEKIHE